MKANLSYLENPDPALLGGGLLHEVFGETAGRHGGRTAVECGPETLGYRELDVRSNQFARLLASRGARRGSRVCLLLQRSIDLYVAMLGALKVGAAYVPIDPATPPERVRFIASDSGAAALVTSLEFLGAASAADTPKIYVNEVRHRLARESGSAPPAEAAPSDEAYVIYTSGTTGKPKGVVVTHANARHLVLAERRVYGVVAEDRVLQGFSPAFDASVEEIWAAFASGATLVVGDPGLMRSGPDLGRLLSRMRITVLSCVPTLLSTAGEPAPSVRLLILGGEALPDRLLEPWFSPVRRIFNTYGPTETTVVAAFSRCHPGEKITIGGPLANYTIRLLDESGAIVEAGRTGEIVIGGPGVAKGYLNRPELTRERFIPNADAAATGDRSPVLYRSGDLARVDAAGALEFLGRADSQVKIRGFRVELAEVEAALRRAPGVRDAAAVLREVDGAGVLAAYVLGAPGARFDERAAVRELRKTLPPYMIPSVIETLREFPTLASGKVDRKALPPPRRGVVAGSAAEFDSPVARAVYDRWARLFGVDRLEASDDFFDDLGGHSLLAARFVSEMRTDPRFAGLSIADLYAHPTLGGLASFLEGKTAAAGPEAAAPRADFRRLPEWRIRLAGVAEAVLLYFVIAFFALQWITPFAVFSFMTAYDHPYWESLGTAILSLCLVYPAMLALGAAAKWLVLGRLREGDHPLWGSYYLRWLFVNRLLSCIPLHFLAGSPLMPWYLRLLGASIGKDVHVDADLVSGMDLLAVGDRASLNADAVVSCHAVEDGLLKLRRVVVGRDVTVGIRSVIGPGARIGNGAVIGDMTCVRPGQTIGAGERWSGSPAARRSNAPATSCESAGERSVPPPEAEAAGPPEALSGLFYAASFLVLPMLALLPIFPGIMLMYVLDYRTEDYTYLLLSPVMGAIFVALSALQIWALKWLVVGKLKAGVHRIKSAFYMRKWFVDKLMETSLDMLQTLYATLYLNPWYRALGVRVGERAEVSTASFILPDLLTIGDGSFIADGAGLGPARIEAGRVWLQPTRIGERTFVGNSAYLPAGASLGDHSLLGVQSLAPESRPPDGTSWLGSPPMRLSRRQKPGRQFAEERTYRPTRALYLQRLAIEFFRVILPATAFVVFTTLMLSFSVQIEDVCGPRVALLAFPALYVGMGVVATLLTALLKRLLIGRWTPDEQPLWSSFVWRTELVTGLCENFTDEFFGQHLVGTVFLPWYLRCLGMTIGRRACILTLDFTEFDLVRLGDDVALNEDATIQTHLFEDRVMKLGTIEVGSRVSVGSATVLLYDTVLEDDVQVGDLSLVMKGERLGRGTRWAGAPVRRAW